jgi:6-phosphogluconolactonase (cycloisomerase 2 family)
MRHLPSSRSPAPLYAYVGCYTTPERQGQGRGISVYRVDGPGDWTKVAITATEPNPSFLAVDPARGVLFAVHGDQEVASAYRIDPDTGELSHLNTQGCGGVNPVHLVLTPGGARLLVAGYRSGTIAALPVDGTGGLSPPEWVMDLAGEAGPDRDEQPGPLPHHIRLGRGGRYVYVPDKGTDRVHQFRLDEGTGTLRPLVPAASVARRGDGPRHLEFHPALNRAYVINELASTVTVYDVDPADGTLTPRQWGSTIPPDCFVRTSAAELVLTPDGRWLFASNRGHDSIARYRVDPADGTLAPVGWTPSGGQTPRFITLDPDAATLYAANQDSHSIRAFQIGAATGDLAPIGPGIVTESPSCIVFASPAAR